MENVGAHVKVLNVEILFCKVCIQFFKNLNYNFYNKRLLFLRPLTYVLCLRVKGHVNITYVLFMCLSAPPYFTLVFPKACVIY
jgi:hypothetical protein